MIFLMAAPFSCVGTQNTQNNKHRGFRRSSMRPHEGKNKLKKGKYLRRSGGDVARKDFNIGMATPHGRAGRAICKCRVCLVASSPMAPPRAGGLSTAASALYTNPRGSLAKQPTQPAVFPKIPQVTTTTTQHYIPVRSIVLSPICLPIVWKAEELLPSLLLAG